MPNIGNTHDGFSYLNSFKLEVILKNHSLNFLQPQSISILSQCILNTHSYHSVTTQE